MTQLRPIKLLVVRAGGVPTVSLAEGDGVADPRVDVSLHSGHHRVIRLYDYQF